MDRDRTKQFTKKINIRKTRDVIKSYLYVKEVEINFYKICN